MTAKVIVLGAGPSGLVAAETAVSLGAHVVVLSLGDHGKPVKSNLFGCQYLHAPVVGGLGPGSPVSYELVGTSSGYRDKVYGPDSQVSVSPDEYGTGEPHLAWNLRLAYDNLWSFWGHRIHALGYPINYGEVKSLLLTDADLVISTIPAPFICGKRGGEDGCLFRSQPIWAMGDAPRQRVPIPCPDDTVICNGTKDTGWYRVARVFGHSTVEYPWRDGRKPPLSGITQVNKPTSHRCKCWAEEPRVLQVGRFGKWEKGYLVHNVFEDVTKAISEVSK